MENLKVYQKLFDIRKSIKAVNKDTEGFNYNYADLPTIKDEVDQPMQDNKCLITITFTHDTCIACFIDIESGEKIEFTSPIEYKDALTKETIDKNTQQVKVSKMSPLQDIGAMQTYMRRYMYILILDLSVEDEIDAKDNKINNRNGKIFNKNTYSGFDGTELDCIIDHSANKQSVSDDVICEILERNNSNYTLEQVKEYYDNKNWAYNGKKINDKFVENAIKNKWIK